MTVHAAPEIDESAVGRILGIASGTPDPVSTLITALRNASRLDPYTRTSPLGDLIEAIWLMHNAWGSDADDQKMNAHDSACDALKRMLDE